jgi:hypothetical protein
VKHSFPHTINRRRGLEVASSSRFAVTPSQIDENPYLIRVFAVTAGSAVPSRCRHAVTARRSSEQPPDPKTLRADAQAATYLEARDKCPSEFRGGQMSKARLVVNTGTEPRSGDQVFCSREQNGFAERGQGTRDKCPQRFHHGQMSERVSRWTNVRSRSCSERRNMTSRAAQRARQMSERVSSRTNVRSGPFREHGNTGLVQANRFFVHVNKKVSPAEQGLSDTRETNVRGRFATDKCPKPAHGGTALVAAEHQPSGEPCEFGNRPPTAHLASQ